MRRVERFDFLCPVIFYTSCHEALRRPVESAQYCTVDYQALLRKHGTLISMSGRGNCYDNSMVETFFKTIKSELVWPVA